MVKSKRAREAVEVEAEDVPVVEQTDAPAKKRKRSEDEPASGDVKKKAKKDKKKDKKETRKEKKDKRKDLQDLPEEEADEEEQPQAAEPEKMDVDVTAADESKKEKKDKKKDKKEKKNKDKEDKKTDGDETVKKDKKDKKDKKKKNKTEEAQENGASKPVDEEKPAEDEGEAAADGKADRHIVFVGNLPYSATSASITAHFASLSPISVRCLTKREDPTACRGIAFVEFGKVWHMRTCLDKFHHSMFNDGISEPRKINVELT
jgi:nucleolar protein 6